MASGKTLYIKGDRDVEVTKIMQIYEEEEE